MSNQFATQRETFRANTEQTRQLYFLLVTLSAGMFTTSDTATLIEDLQKRNMHLLQINCTFHSHVSLAVGLAAGELDLNSLDLDQETFVALHRIQAESKDLWDQTAIPAAPAKAAHQVAHGTRHKRIRPGGKGSDQSSDSSHEDKPPALTDTASSSMTATGLAEHSPSAEKPPSPGSSGGVPFHVLFRFDDDDYDSFHGPGTSRGTRHKGSGVPSPYDPSSFEDDEAPVEGSHSRQPAAHPDLPSPSSHEESMDVKADDGSPEGPREDREDGEAVFDSPTL
ncbi:hypothetical protein PC110_g19682 [Phytophthora cactorum]|uniref:Uncharacterized protein n=1 Tax=Phytophthora cactorum TaxID=29920 RepID=A0A329RGZ9_9STRA|nr:hypothetical protein PC110_g19682 [Phytophthora cactorum]